MGTLRSVPIRFLIRDISLRRENGVAPYGYKQEPVYSIRILEYNCHTSKLFLSISEYKPRGPHDHDLFTALATFPPLDPLIIFKEAYISLLSSSAFSSSLARPRTYHFDQLILTLLSPAYCTNLLFRENKRHTERSRIQNALFVILSNIRFACSCNFKENLGWGNDGGAWLVIRFIIIVVIGAVLIIMLMIVTMIVIIMKIMMIFIITTTIATYCHSY